MDSQETAVNQPSPGTSERVAHRVRRLCSELNSAIRDAAKLGYRVEAQTIDIGTLGDTSSVLITVDVWQHAE